MIEEGMFLYFVPPYFASGDRNVEYKKRLMLVVKKNELDNTLTLVNVSKLKGKPNCFTYPFNILIRKFNPPLPMLSFAKINGNYIVENFNGLDKYLYKDGLKIDLMEYNNIIDRYNKYIVNNKIDIISFTKDEFMITNK